MGIIVIASYHPKVGKEEELDSLLKAHVPRLRKLGLVTDRAPIMMKSRDGTRLEVFEWHSTQAIEKAHAHPEVAKMWEAYEAVCEYRPIADLPESSQLFAEFSSC